MMTDGEDPEKLDAYGHLAWTVGTEDWLVCFDAIRTGDTIRYHVVVDSESGGFTDTVEHGEFDVTDPDGRTTLWHLPGDWADRGRELYPEDSVEIATSWVDMIASWRKHLGQLYGSDLEQLAAVANHIGEP